MTYSEIIDKISLDTGIKPEIIDKVYKAYWLYIRNSVQELPLKEDISEAEFLNLRTNFNIPSLGKLICTYDRYRGMKKRFQHIRNIRKRDEEAKED